MIYVKATQCYFFYCLEKLYLILTTRKINHAQLDATRLISFSILIRAGCSECSD